MIPERSELSRSVKSTWARMRDAGFYQRYELFTIPRKATPDKTRTHGNRRSHRVDVLHLVDSALFRRAAGIRRGRELAFGEPIDSVIFDQVQHVDVAPDDMTKLAKTDRQ